MSTATATDYAVERIDDLARRPENELREYAELVRTLDHEVVPEDPLAPVEVVLARFRSLPSMARRTDRLVRTPDGELVASAVQFRYETDENPHLRDSWISVRADHRRRGLGHRLLGELVGAAGEAPGLVLTFGSNDRVPAGEAFLRRIGAQPGLATHVNQAAVAEIDPALVREWAHLDPSGYRLVWIDGDVPDELMANVLAAYSAMNLAPRGDIRMNDWHETPERIREWDRIRRRRGRERRLLLAINAATGETAGYTETAFDPRMPHVIQQQGTAVIPAHQGRGIGKWIKAAMLERLLPERPSARFVRTGNADVNAPMLSINRRLGFKPAWASTWWQIPLPDARRYLEARGL